MKTKVPSSKKTKVMMTFLLIGMIAIHVHAQLTVYNTSNSNIPGNRVTAIAIDPKGTKWVGTESATFQALTGLSKYNGGTSFTSWGPGNSAMSAGNVFSIAFDSLNNVWTGTGHGVNKLSGTTIIPIILSGNDYIQEIAIDKKGYLWASAHSGLFRVKRSNNTWSIYDGTTAPAMGGAKLNAVSVDNSGNVWTGGWDSGVRKFDGNSTWTQYNSGNSVIPGDWTNFIGKDSSGNMWVTSQGNVGMGNLAYVGKYDGNTWTIYKHTSKGGPVPSAQIYSMSVDKKNGVIWFGSWDKGLIKYNGTTWQVFDMSNTPGLPSNEVNGVALDSDGSLWIATSAGLVHWSCTAPTITVSSGTTICSGTTTTISASGADSYTWSPATGLNTSIGSTVIASPSVTTTYTVTGIKNPGCASNKTITVTVKATPVVTANAGPDVSFCSGSSSSLTANGGTSFSWSPSTGLSASNIANPIAKPAATTTYTVTVSATANGCTGTATDQVIVNVNPLPVVTTNGGGAICSGNATNILAGGGTSYSWSPVTSLSSSTIANPAANPSSDITYTVTVTNVNGCSAKDSVSIIVYPAPPIPTITKSGNVLTSSSIDVLIYEWYKDGNQISGANSQTHTVTGNGSYYVVVTNADGCSATSTPVNIGITGLKDIQTLNAAIINSYFDTDKRELIIRLYSPDKDQYSVELFNLSGQQILKTIVAECSGLSTEYIQTPYLVKGIYILSVTSSRTESVAYKKLVVN